MKGFHVDEPAFLVDIPSLNPAHNFASSSALEHPINQGLFSGPVKQEELIPIHDLESNATPPQSSKGLRCTSISSVEERSGNRGADCFGMLSCNPIEQLKHLGSSILPGGGNNKNRDDSVYRSVGRMDTDSTHGGSTGDLLAFMEAMNGNHLSGVKYCMDDIEREYRSSVQASIAPIAGRHLGRLKESIGNNHGSCVDDPQASRFTFSSMSLPGDGTFLRFLPSNHEDFFSSDDFRMYEFKVRRCMRGRSHDWTECPFAHPGEKARRRDPRRFLYSGTACPDFRRGTCRRGDACELSHGVFECWLHPARYRTQPCKDGKSCKRRVCFFAHSSSQLRYVSPERSPDDGDAMKSPLASPTDVRASYSDLPYKHLPFFANNPSPVGQVPLGGYGADAFFDDFIPINFHGSPQDGSHDGFYPLDVHSKKVQKNCKNSHCHGFSVDDFPNHLMLNSHSFMPSSDGHLVDGVDHDLSLYPCTPGNPSTESSSFKTSQTHVNLRNQLALASLISKRDQIMSPTSTLIGHVFSPPPLSPPLSPSESPPMSPGTAFPSWSTLSRKIASVSGQTPSQCLAAGMDANPMVPNGTSPSVLQFQASLLTNMVHSNGASLFANTLGPSPLSTNSLGDQNLQLDRVGSMPTSQELIEEAIPLAMSTEAYPPQAMAHLISTLQQMDLRRATTDVENKRRSYVLHSDPHTPKSKESWDVNGVTSHQRVESGQGLRAKIHGKLGRETGVEMENPDFGWVNELVK